MKLFIAIVQDEDADGLAAALVEEGFRFTRLSTAGGFLRRGNVTFLLGVEQERIGALLAVVRRNAKTRMQIASPIPAMMEPGELAVPYPVEVQVGGATMFVFDVERFERL